jgi:hypothetical protein
MGKFFQTLTFFPSKYTKKNLSIHIFGLILMRFLILGNSKYACNFYKINAIRKISCTMVKAFNILGNYGFYNFEFQYI